MVMIDDFYEEFYIGLMKLKLWWYVSAVFVQLSHEEVIFSQTDRRTDGWDGWTDGRQYHAMQLFGPYLSRNIRQSNKRY